MRLFPNLENKMKRISHIFIVLIITTFCLKSYSQKVIVTEQEEKVDEMKRKGLAIMLELDEEVVRKEWLKKLREYGSVKTKSGAILVEQANMPNVSMTPIKIISTVQNNTKGTKVWYAIDLGDAYVTADGDKTKYNEASKVLHDFGVNMYIQDINEQIKEAEKVLAGAVKEQERLITKGESIKSSIGKNRLEKIKLQQKIAETDSTYKTMKVDSLQNVQNQKAATENVDKMKRAVDMVKNKITKVE